MTSTIEKKFKHDELFQKLNNKWNISKFVQKKIWTKVYILRTISTILKFIGKQQNNLHIGHQNFLKDTNIM